MSMQWGYVGLGKVRSNKQYMTTSNIQKMQELEAKHRNSATHERGIRN
jgi:hypothetical protein